MKLLVAEDSPIIQKVLCKRLLKWGYAFDAVSDGRMAVEVARRNPGAYDLCLMDVNMPDMTGIEATQEIRKSVGYFPIIGLTSEISHRQACLGAGMDAFLLKGCQDSELLARIRELSVKWYQVSRRSGDLRVSPTKPLNKAHVQELGMLASHGLCRVVFFDTVDSCLTVHGNALAKVHHELNVEKRLLTTFLNRDAENPTLCYLFRENNLMPQTNLMAHEYRGMLKEEDAALSEYQGHRLSCLHEFPALLPGSVQEDSYEQALSEDSGELNGQCVDEPQ